MAKKTVVRKGTVLRKDISKTDVSETAHYVAKHLDWRGLFRSFLKKLIG